MMRVRRCALFAMTAAILLAPIAPAWAQSKEVVILAAASLNNALDDASAAWTKQTGKTTRISYAASSALAKQVEAGIPADVFISADVPWMNHVAERKLIKVPSRSDRLGNHLPYSRPLPDWLGLARACRLPAVLAPSLYSFGYIAAGRPRMTAIPGFEPLALRHKNGPAGAPMGALSGMTLAPLPLRMIDPATHESPERRSRRKKIRELSSHVHCSIVGTCLTTGELRQLLVKAGMAADGASDHDLHGRGVSLAGQHDGQSKLLHKALDRKHRTTIARFEKAGTIDEVRSQWRLAVKQGDIPGAYWAAITHPAANDALIREIFGEVHMLSHMVGAANRADIRRLAELEAENDRLRDKLARQQDHLRDGITSRDATIQELNSLLARRMADDAGVERADDTSDRAALERVIGSREQRLRSESNRRAAVEERLARTSVELSREREQHTTLRRHERALREELEAVEADFGREATPDEAMPSSLAGLSLLYVGGRTDRLGHLRALSEERGAKFLHHDGGVDDRSGLLAGLVSRADVVLFPVDCVSHEAVMIVKRLCYQMSKPYLPLRSTGISSFVAALGSDAVAGLQVSADSSASV